MVETKKSRPPPRPSRGSQMLADAAGREGGSNRAAEKVGADSGSFSKWIRGLSIPTATWRVSLEDEYGIPVRAWDEAAEKPSKASKKRKAA